MSTRSSIAYTDDFHLFLETLDNHVYLEWNHIDQRIRLFSEEEWEKMRKQIIEKHERWEKFKEKLNVEKT